jgi:hypothetical protein
LKKAHNLVLQYNNLPPLSDIKLETLDEDGEVEIRMTGIDEFTQDYRWMHIYKSNAKFAVDEYLLLTSIIKDLSTRNYIRQKYLKGIMSNQIWNAILGGKNIIQLDLN